MSLYKISILFIIVIIALGFLVAWVVIRNLLNQQELPQASISTSTFQEMAILGSTSTVPTSATQELKTYRNEEWGFEFEYPRDWILKESTFRSYYSKFNLEIKVPKGKYLDLAFDVNIVLPEFVDRSFGSMEKTTSEVIVGGRRGIKYDYQFEGLPETTVILSFGELRMILGTGGGSKQYLEEFNQILTTFKFLK